MLRSDPQAQDAPAILTPCGPYVAAESNAYVISIGPTIVAEHGSKIDEACLSSRACKLSSTSWEGLAGSHLSYSREPQLPHLPKAVREGPEARNHSVSESVWTDSKGAKTFRLWNRCGPIPKARKHQTVAKEVEREFPPARQ